MSAPGEEMIRVETSLYRAVWSNRGGTLRSWALLKHLSAKREPLELVSPRAAELGRYPFSLEAKEIEGAADINQKLFRPSATGLELKDGEKGEIKFEYSDGNSIKVEKSFIFYGGRYDFDIQTALWVDGKKVEPRVIWGPGLSEPGLVEKKGAVQRRERDRRSGWRKGLSCYREEVQSRDERL